MSRISWIAPPLALCIIAALGGCAAQQRAEAKAKFELKKAECDRDFPEKIGNYVQNAICRNRVANEFNIAINFPHLDLTEVYFARRLKMAERQDRGEISQTDAAVELATLKSALNSDMRRRDNEAASVRASQQAAMIPYMQMQQQQSQFEQQQQTQRELNMRMITPVIQPNINCTSQRIGQMVNTNCY